jgi:maleylpyruvate isomerase
VLNHLTREELDGASLVVPGRTRRHVITEVGYQARALTRLTEWTASGVATPMFADPAQRLEEIADGATLPDRALRGLFHSRRGPSRRRMARPDGKPVGRHGRRAGRRGDLRPRDGLAAGQVPLASCRGLDNGGSFLDFPPALVDRLIAESAAQWTGPSCCRNAEQVLSMNFCRASHRFQR